MADALILILGLGVLYFGGELFVKGSSRLAVILGMSPLLIGLTVVAFGTSAPELGVSLQAAFAGSPSITVGNVVGSNLFNTFVILGLSALVAPLVVNRQLVRLDVPVMIGASLVMGAFAYSGSFSRIEGVIFLLALSVYIFWLFKKSREDVDGEVEGINAEPQSRKNLIKIGMYLIFGLLGLYFGSKWTVQGAVLIAQSFNIPERIIAITIISAGTSLPELATSVIATFRGERDMAVGNVVGSNVMNILLILGVSALVYPWGLEVSGDLLTFDIPVAIFAAILCFPLFFKNVMNRFVGALFLGLYLGYLVIIL